MSEENWFARFECPDCRKSFEKSLEWLKHHRTITCPTAECGHVIVVDPNLVPLLSSGFQRELDRLRKEKDASVTGPGEGSTE